MQGDKLIKNSEQSKKLIVKFEIQNVHTFEEAVELTGTGKLHGFVLLVAGIALLAVWVEGLNMGYVMPAVRCEMNLTHSEQGLINGAGFIGVIISAHFWGFMSDTWGRKKVLQFALLFGFTFSAISSFSYCATMLAVSRFFVGLFISGAQAAAISYVGEFHSVKTRSRHVTLATCFMPGSTLYQGLVGIFVMPMTWRWPIFGLLFSPWRLYLLSCSCICLVAFVGIGFLPESPKFLLAIGKQDEALAVLRRVYRINTGKREETFPVQELAMESIGSNVANANGIREVLHMIWIQTKPLFQRPHLSNMLMTCYLMMALYFSSHGYCLWFPQILNYYYGYLDQSLPVCGAVTLGIAAKANATMTLSSAVNEFNQTTVGNATMNAVQMNCQRTGDPRTFYIFFIMGAIYVAVYSTVSLNIRRLRMDIVLTIWIFLTALTSFVSVWTTNFYLNIFLGYVIISSGSCGALLSALCADLFPTRYKGMALCFILMFGRIGAVIGGNIIGALIANYCDYILFYFNAGSLIVCMYIGYVAMGRIKSVNDLERRELDEKEALKIGDQF